MKLEEGYEQLLNMTKLRLTSFFPIIDFSKIESVFVDALNDLENILLKLPNKNKYAFSEQGGQIFHI